MESRVCLDAYGCQPKPSESVVHASNNFQRSSLAQHQSGKDHIMAMNIINRRRSHNMVVHHIQAKASMPLKAQLRMASVIGKKKISDRKFNALIDLQVS